MPEVLRDLVVSLSLKSDNFTRNINSINRQIREAESQFRLAGAGVDRFGSTTAGMNSRMTLLQTTLQHQRAAVDQYERALAKANSRLQESHARYQTYSTRLQEVKQRHDDLAEKLRSQEDYLREIAELCGTDCDAYRAEAEILNQLQAEYAPVNEEMKKLTGQCDALQKAMQRDADAVSKARTDLNNAKAAVRETESEIRKLNEQLRTAGSAWTDVGTQLEIVSKKFTAFGKEATKIGKTLSKTITAPVLALGTYAMKASLDFESSFASVRRTVNGTEEDFEHLAEVSKSMSTEIATSTDDINFVMATGGQLGIETENIESFTRAMIDLSNASTDLDAETAATQLAKFANIMGTSHSDFDRIGSAVAELGNNFATTEAPIVEMAMRLAGAGKQVGLSEAQVLGLSAALSSVGIKAQAGGSSMSKALIEMEVAAKQGGQALTDFAMVCNMSEQQFVDAWSDDPVQVFQAFIEGLAQMDDEGASAIVTLNELGISEIRLRDTLLRATNAHELFANAQAMATSAYEANTALADKSSKKYNTLASRMTNVKNKAKLFAQTLGNDLRPTIEKILQGVSNFIDRLEGMSSGQRKVILTLATLAAAAGPVLIVIGKLSTGIGAVSGALGKFSTAVGKAGGGIKGFLSVLGSSPAIWLAVGSAVAYGTYKLIDYVSGAKAAREATAALNAEAKSWAETQANTLYDTGSSDPLSMFGLSREAFQDTSTIKAAQNWFDDLITVWTDGKGETDEIVRQYTEGFVSGSDDVREAIQKQSQLLSDYNVLTPEQQATMDADLAQLQAWDDEVAALLKKRQNGFLTDEEQARLEEIIEKRGEIEVKYRLDTGDGYDQIVTGMHAAVERAKAQGADVGSEVYGDTLNALAEGRKAYMDALDASYDSEYAQIQLIEDETARTQALLELNQRYNEQRQKGEDAYNESVKQAATEAWTAGNYEEQVGKVQELAALMGDLSGKSLPEIQEEFSDLGLDEGELASMLSLVEQLKAAGATDEELLNLGIDYEQLMLMVEGIRDIAKETEGLEGIGQMFGESLPEEIQRIMIGLDMTQAAEDWAAFAEGGSLAAIKADVEPNDVDASDVTVTGAAVVNGELKSVTGKKGTTYEVSGVSVSVDGTLGTVTGADGVTYTVTGATVNADGTLATVTAEDGTTYTVTDADVDVDGTLKSVTGEDGVTYTVSGVKASVDGTLGTITGEDNKEYKVVSAVVKADGTLAAVTCEDNKTYTVKDGKIQAEATLESVVADAKKTYEVTGATVTAKASIKLNPLDRAAVDAWQKQNGNKSMRGLAAKVNVKLGAGWQGKLYTAFEEGKLAVYGADGLPLDVTPTVAAKITANDVAVYDDDGTIHVFITPDVGSPEAVEQTMEANESTPLDNTILRPLAESNVEYLQRMSESYRDLLKYRKDLESLNGDPFGFTEEGMSAQGLNDSITTLQSFIGSNLIEVAPERFNEIGAAAANLMAALENPDLDPEMASEYTAQLQQILDLVSAADEFYGPGNDISAGIAEGMTQYEWSGDAESLKGSLESAINTALDRHSPAGVMKPVGQDVSAGIAEGMTQYDFTAEAGTTINALKAAFSASALADVGKNAMAGLAQGIRNGTASVVNAMRMAALAAVNAAKETLKIESPSRVFRDEVGVMMMRGLGEGVLDSQREQARIIQNASRYLTEQAQGGIVVGNTHNDNRQNIQQTSSVNLSGNNFYVRSDQDIHDLAVEIATLTRTEQRGRGLRMA